VGVTEAQLQLLVAVPRELELRLPQGGAARVERVPYDFQCQVVVDRVKGALRRRKATMAMGSTKATQRVLIEGRGPAERVVPDVMDALRALVEPLRAEKKVLVCDTLADRILSVELALELPRALALEHVTIDAQRVFSMRSPQDQLVGVRTWALAKVHHPELFVSVNDEALVAAAVSLLTPLVRDALGGARLEAGHRRRLDEGHALVVGEHPKADSGHRPPPGGRIVADLRMRHATVVDRDGADVTRAWLAGRPVS
jgi:hypothetical protein